MILITAMKKDGTEGNTYPHSKSDDVNEATERFIEFVKDNPLATLDMKTAKIRRVVEMEEITEITIPEPGINALLKQAMDIFGSKPDNKI